MTHAIRLSTASRAKALEAGRYQRSDGSFVDLKTMGRTHLVNALLKAITDGSPNSIVLPLTREVARRNLGEFALAIASARDQRR